MNSAEPKRVVILGGSFTRLYTALELEKLLPQDSPVEVTLVNRENFSLSTPILHEIAASDVDLTNIVNPRRKLLQRTHFVANDIISIDRTTKRVVVAHDAQHHHQALEYYQLVIVFGGIISFYTLPCLERNCRD